MILKPHKPYISIVDFQESEIPEFTILTGPNGVGKTHLLQAIKNESIKVTINNESHKGEIVLFDWSTLVPDDFSEAAAAGISRIKPAVIEEIKSSRKRLLTQIEEQYASDGHGVFNWKKFTDPSLDLENIAAYQQLMIKIVSRARNRLKSSSKQSMLDKLIDDHGLGKTIANPDHYLEDKILDEVGVFQQSLAHIFLAYNEVIARNLIMRGRDDRDALSDEKLIEVYGPPPWLLINDILAKSGIDFTISNPDPVEHRHKFTPEITKNSSMASVKFSTMSSGERILISLALCLYNLDSKNLLVKKPKLVLFDEVDAVLHPTMVQFALNAINETIVGLARVPVILSTHSPTTVALSPDESVYAVREGGRIEHCGRQKAINLLTTGIPTLAIDYEGRRQVFVESMTDVKIYEKLFQSLAKLDPPEVSLHFIATGVRSAKGDVNTGCTNVSRIVKDLRDSGNSAVYGVIDWDNKNTPSDGIEVLAENEHYSLENILLNPLAVASFLLFDDKNFSQEVSVGFGQLSKNPAKHAQMLVNAFMSKLPPELTTSAAIVVKHKDGFEIEYSESYAKFNGHELEDKLRAIFPCLNAYSNPVDKFKHEVVHQIYCQEPGLIPLHFDNLFTTLLNK